MKILDLRPWTVRFMTNRWQSVPKGRQEPAYGNRNQGLGPRLMGRIVDRLMLPRLASRSIPTGSPWLVSVGNLALGGTGKTPVVMALAQELARRGLKGAVLTRGFGSPLKGPLEVIASNQNAGDEARLMAQRLEGSRWPVMQSRDRLAGLSELGRQRSDLDLIVIEDGHQTARLGRHLDILILDRWEILTEGSRETVRAGSGPLFPFGPWRETTTGAGRAALWILETKADLPPAGEGGTAVTGFSRTLHLTDPRAPEKPARVAGSWAVLSGIARPEAFERHSADLTGTPPVLAVRCGDHAQYGPRLVARIAAEATAAGASCLITTAKDWIKIQAHWRVGPPVLVAELEINWEGNTATLPDLVEERYAAYKASL